MAREDYGAFTLPSGEASETAAKLDLFRGEQFLAHAAQFAEGGCLAENEGTSRPASEAANEVPALVQDPAEASSVFESDERAAAQVSTGFNGARDLLEEGARGIGIGIDED